MRKKCHSHYIISACARSVTRLILGTSPERWINKLYPLRLCRTVKPYFIDKRNISMNNSMMQNTERHKQVVLIGDVNIIDIGQH